MDGSARFFGETGGKIGINVEKWSFCQDLSRKFSRFSLTHQNTLSYTFSDQIHPPPLKAKKTPKKLKNCIFGQISNSSLIFYPLPILGLSFKFYYAPYPVTVSKLDEAKFRFRNLRLSKVIKEKPKGVNFPLVQEGLRSFCLLTKFNF